MHACMRMVIKWYSYTTCCPEFCFVFQVIHGLKKNQKTYLKDSILSLAQHSERAWCVKLISLRSLMKLVPGKLVTCLGTACTPLLAMAGKSSLSSPLAQLQHMRWVPSRPPLNLACVLHCGPDRCHCTTQNNSV